MDLASLIGLLLGVGFLLYGMLDGGGTLSSFWSFSSIAVTMVEELPPQFLVLQWRI